MKNASSFLILIVAIVLIQCTNYQVKYEKIYNGMVVESNKIRLKIQFYNDNIVRILKWIPGSSPEKKSLIVEKDSIPPVNYEINNAEKFILLTTDKIKIKISKSNGSITYIDKDENIILKEGKTEITPVNLDGEETYNIKQELKLIDNEGIYGLGQHQNGVMNYRGNEVKLVQTNIDAVNFADFKVGLLL